MPPTHPLPPDQTPEQRAAHLADARARRAELATLRADLREQRHTLAEVFAMIDAPAADGRPSVAARARIGIILISVHGIGTGRVNRLLTSLDISADRTLISLSVQQRHTILTTVTEWTARPPGSR